MHNADTPIGSPPRKKMPAEVFVKIWKGEMEVKGTEWEKWVKISGSLEVEFKGLEVDEVISVEKNENLLPHLTLLYCVLSNIITLENAQIQSVTIKEGTLIIGSFDIKNSVTGDISIRSDSKTWSFLIQNSTVGNLVIGGNSTSGDFLILDNSRTGDFSIWENSEIESIGVHRNSRIKKVELRKNSKVGDIGIYESSSAEDFQILSNSSIRDFALEDSMIGDFKIRGISTAGNFKSKNSNAGKFQIYENSNTGAFSFKDSVIEEFRIKSSVTESILMTGGSVNELVITYATLRRIEIIRNCQVTRFRCRLPLQNPAQLTFSKSIFGELDFGNIVFPEFATLQVSNCKVHHLSFHNFCNFGAIFLSDIQILNKAGNPSTLRFADSDLGKMQFINCDLQQFERFRFSDTKMLEVFVAGSQMPDDKAFRLSGEEDEMAKPLSNQELNDLKRRKAEQKRLAYGQFKKIYEARGDVAGSLRYLAFEMEAYREELRLEKPNSRKEWFNNRNERFILWFNRYSTNYGNNWLRGVGVTLLVTIVCFSAYCFLLGYRPQPIGGDWVKFGDLASHSLAYLNPFRDEDSGKFFEMVKEDGLKITWYARFWDYLSRIFIAYFVYQTIQAFRKLGKSSG